MPKTSTEKMRTHRANVRATGMKLIQVWVPDPAAPGFAEALRRQCLAANADEARGSDTDWIEALAAFDDPQG